MSSTKNDLKKTDRPHPGATAGGALLSERKATKTHQKKTSKEKKGTDRKQTRQHIPGDMRPKKAQKKGRGPSDSSRSQISVSISESKSELTRLEHQRILTRDLGNFAKGRGRFDDFSRGDFGRATEIFFHAGYYRIETIETMQEHARIFSIATLRKTNTRPSLRKSTRLSLDLIETFQTKTNNSKDPRIEEVQIPREMARWGPSMSSFTGVLVPGQDMVYHFTIELDRCRNETPCLSAFRDRRPYR